MNALPDMPDMPDNNHPSWLKKLTHRVDGLWDWMHTIDAERTAWWTNQRDHNKKVENRMQDHGARIRKLELSAAKIALGAAVGAALGGALMSWLLDKV